MVAHLTEDQVVTVRFCLAPCAGVVVTAACQPSKLKVRVRLPVPASLRDCGSTEEHDVAIVETRVRLPPVAPVQVVEW